MTDEDLTDAIRDVLSLPDGAAAVLSLNEAAVSTDALVSRARRQLDSRIVKARKGAGR